MELEEALLHFSEFKKGNLKLQLKEIKDQLIGKTKSEVKGHPSLYEAALFIKKSSSQIDEVVHASGILKCLPLILNENEIIKDLSLAAGADGEGIDLITDQRIAEFKFSRWQQKGSNGSRKWQVFADLVNLLIKTDQRKKELYVLDAEKIKKYFLSEKASWQNVLSKSGGLKEKLAIFLKERNLEGLTLKDIFEIETISIIDIDKIIPV